jgi:hypothetical protein
MRKKISGMIRVAAMTGVLVVSGLAFSATLTELPVAVAHSSCMPGHLYIYADHGTCHPGQAYFYLSDTISPST